MGSQQQQKPGEILDETGSKKTLKPPVDVVADDGLSCSSLRRMRLGTRNKQGSSSVDSPVGSSEDSSASEDLVYVLRSEDVLDAEAVHLERQRGI